MCGLIGYSGKLTYEDLRLRILFMYNESRGVDSSGFYHNGDEPIKDRLFHEVGPASQKLLPSYDFGARTLFLGHTRHATYGDKTAENAHPFYINKNKAHKPVVGVHNGKLENHFDLREKYEIPYAECSVDSKVIFNIIQKTDEATVLHELYDLENAIMYTREDNILRVLRLTKRELYYGFVEYENDDSKGMYISSMPTSLAAIGCDGITLFKENILYKIEEGKIAKESFVERQPFKRPVPVHSHTNVGAQFENWRRPHLPTVGRGLTSLADNTEALEITFTKLSYLGDTTSAEPVINQILKEAKYSRLAEQTNQKDPHLLEIEDATNGMGLTEEDMPLIEDQELLEHLSEYLSSVKRIVTSRGDTLKTLIKALPPSVSSAADTLQDIVTDFDMLALSLSEEVEYLQTGDAKLKQEEAFEADGVPGTA